MLPICRLAYILQQVHELVHFSAMLLGLKINNYRYILSNISNPSWLPFKSNYELKYIQSCQHRDVNRLLRANGNETFFLKGVHCI